MPRQIEYPTPSSSSGSNSFRRPWRTLAQGAWKHGQKLVRKYLNDKAYAERMRRMKQGQEIENQRLNDLSRKRKMTGNNKANNVLVNKSSMVVRGKNKLKKRKVLKLSSKFKQGVKQVMSGTTARGTYTTVKQGYVGSLVRNGAAYVLTGADIGQANVTQVAGPGTSQPTGSRTLFNALVARNVSAFPSVLAETSFNYFTPAKILDAASVLFNNKGIGNPYVTTGNLSETVVLASGAPVTSLPTLKIDIINSSVVWRMKNLSNRVVTVDIWECTSTLKFANAVPIQALVGLSALATTVTNSNPIKYVIGTTDSPTWYLEQAMDPLATAKHYGGFPWTWKKRSMVMQPHETCVHTIKGPSGTLDFRKLVSVSPDGTNIINLNSLLKGFSVGCILSINGDQVLKPDVNSAVGGRDAFTTTEEDVGLLGMPVSIEIEEKYRIAVPEIAGYIARTPLSSDVQMLNLRKHRYIFVNKVGLQAPTEADSTGYIVGNEETPMDVSDPNVWYQ